MAEKEAGALQRGERPVSLFEGGADGGLSGNVYRRRERRGSEGARGDGNEGGVEKHLERLNRDE